MRPFELTCDLSDGERDSYTEIRLRGYFDARGVQYLEKAQGEIVSSGRYYVIMDIEELDYISSAGMGSIMAFFQELRRRKGNLVLLRPSRRVMDLLNLLGFSKLFPIAESRAAAGEYLSTARQT